MFNNISYHFHDRFYQLVALCEGVDANIPPKEAPASSTAVARLPQKYYPQPSANNQNVQNSLDLAKMCYKQKKPNDGDMWIEHARKLANAVPDANLRENYLNQIKATEESLKNPQSARQSLFGGLKRFASDALEFVAGSPQPPDDQTPTYAIQRASAEKNKGNAIKWLNEAMDRARKLPYQQYEDIANKAIAKGKELDIAIDNPKDSYNKYASRLNDAKKTLYNKNDQRYANEMNAQTRLDYLWYDIKTSDLHPQQMKELEK